MSVDLITVMLATNLYEEMLTNARSVIIHVILIRVA